MSIENQPLPPSIEVEMNTWTVQQASDSSCLLTSTVEPCIIACVYFPDQCTYFGHFTLSGDNPTEEKTEYTVFGFDPISMFDDIRQKLADNSLDGSGAQMYVYGGGIVTFENTDYNDLVTENFEYIADIANELAIDDVNKHIEPLPQNSNMVFSIDPSNGQTMVETLPSKN